MTELNHRRGTRQRRRLRRGVGSWGSLPAGQCKGWQRIAHHKRRGLVRKLIAVNPDDIPGNTPKHIRWDYW